MKRLDEKIDGQKENFQRILIKGIEFKRKTFYQWVELNLGELVSLNWRRIIIFGNLKSRL